jgi:hypothetical protein
MTRAPAATTRTVGSPFALLPHRVVTSWSSPFGATVSKPVLIHSAHWAGGNDPRAGRFNAALMNSSWLDQWVIPARPLE